MAKRKSLLFVDDRPRRVPVAKWKKLAAEAVAHRKENAPVRRTKKSAGSDRKAVSNSSCEEKNEVLTAKEAWELLRISKNTGYPAADRGEIPHRRIGNKYLFSRSRLLDWIRGN